MSNFDFYEHNRECIYYTNSYYTKINKIRDSISKWKNSSNSENSDVSSLFQIICDFDHTLTDPSSDQCHHVLGYYTPIPEFVSTVVPYFNFRQRPVNPNEWWNIFNGYTLKYEIEAWMVDHCVDLVLGSKDDICENALKTHGFTDELMNQLKEANAKKMLKMRRFCREFIHFSHSKNIPILIVSAGIEDLIYKFLQKYDCMRNNITILANKMIWETNENNKTETENEMKTEHATNKDEKKKKDRRKLSKWDEQQTTSLNKSETYDKLKNTYFNDESTGGRRFAIFMGDSATDIDTMKNINTIEEYISIGFVTKDYSYRVAKYMNIYDIVIDESALNMGNRYVSLEWCYQLLYHLIECKDKSLLVTEKDEEMIMQATKEDEPMKHETNDITDMLLSKRSMYNLKIQS